MVIIKKKIKLIMHNSNDIKAIFIDKIKSVIVVFFESLHIIQGHPLILKFNQQLYGFFPSPKCCTIVVQIFSCN